MDSKKTLLTKAPHLDACEASDITKNPYKVDFSLLASDENLHYLDSAATAQRPEAVVEAQKQFYESVNANALRGLYELSVEATQLVEDARQTVARFIHAKSLREIIFTKNTTESLNLAAHSLGELLLKPGDNVVVSVLEHHSNFLPWQVAAKAHGAEFRVIHPNKDGHFTEEELAEKIDDRTKIVAITHVSNVLGTIAPVEKAAEIAHAHGAVCVVDAAQSVPHMQVDVQKLGCDLLAFSAHKVFGPFGVGVLWGRLELLEAMPPFLTGGEMIDFVSEEGAVWAPVPQKFEAGTMDAAGIAGTAVALRYLEEVGMEAVEAREKALVSYLYQQLSALPFVHVLGPKDASRRIGVVSFTLDGIHPHDVASLLDSKHVCIRAGHHCAEPLHVWVGADSTNRASVAFYNDKADIDALIEALTYVWEVFHGSK